MASQVEGNTIGLKKKSMDRLSRLYRRRIPAEEVSTQEFNRELAGISHDIGRQVGALVNRRGQVEHVVVGNAGAIMLPDLGKSRGDPSRFRGLRYIHTHLNQEPLSDEDITDMALLRFDLVLAVTVDEDGYPGESYLAHLMPGSENGEVADEWEPIPPGRIDVDFVELMDSLEEEFQRRRPALMGREQEGVILVGVELPGERLQAEKSGIDSMSELRELARSSGVDVLDEVVQRRKQVHPRTVIGSGKIRELVIRAMQVGAVTLVFDRELSPAQVNAIQKLTELKVIDRAQLILDIFAQRAKTREGKIQVELAQLNYNLPRLVGKGVDMSRLTGGIGSRGPGETRLEIDRRRVRERINRLQKDLENIRKTRQQKREKRRSREVPVVSIIGYTNAGKSTLLNQLTGSEVDVQDRMFATLDPTSRRLRFPREREIIVTDTVGFIRELPKGLYAAFRATLEELEDASLLLQVVDASDPSWEGQIHAVGKIIEDLELQDVPRIIVFNKSDLVSDMELGVRLSRFENSVAISALDRSSFRPMLEKMDMRLFSQEEPDGEAWQSMGF